MSGPRKDELPTALLAQSLSNDVCLPFDAAMRLLALLDARATDIHGWDSFHLDPTDPEEPVCWGTTLAEHLPGRESVSFAREGIEREPRDSDQRTDVPDADGLYSAITWDGMHGPAR